ncbi:MAG: hypothetical protein ACREP2_05945 [Rhodanobacteraceae bacterium]
MSPALATVVAWLMTAIVIFVACCLRAAKYSRLPEKPTGSAAPESDLRHAIGLHGKQRHAGWR